MQLTESPQQAQKYTTHALCLRSTDNELVPMLQMAYIMAVNANIIADTGGPCSSKDCTVRSLSAACFAHLDHAGRMDKLHQANPLLTLEGLHLALQGPDKSFDCRFFDPGYLACVVRISVPVRLCRISPCMHPTCSVSDLYMLMLRFCLRLCCGRVSAARGAAGPGDGDGGQQHRSVLHHGRHGQHAARAGAWVSRWLASESRELDLTVTWPSCAACALQTPDALRQTHGGRADSCAAAQQLMPSL